MASIHIDHGSERMSLADLAALTVEIQQSGGLMMAERARRLTPRSAKPRGGHIGDAFAVEAGGTVGVGPGGVAVALRAVKPFGAIALYNLDFRFRFIDEGTRYVRPMRILERAGESVEGFLHRET